MTARYAIYYVPPADTPLWRMACAWLGRDPSGKAVKPRPDLPELEGLDLDALTQDPRHYGFHATLKAPFELAAWRSEAELVTFTRRFARQRSPFEAQVAPAALGRFLAFRLNAPCPQMDDLHAACVRIFDPFRAPISEFDLARRRKAPLTPQQDARLLEWGYPYVFDDFRFHMTLTNGIAEEAVRTRLLGALQAHFKPVSGLHRFDGVAVFKQADRDAPFQIVERCGFAEERPALPRPALRA